MREYKFYINDIRAAIDKISEYVEGISFEDFKEDSKTYDSVLHNLMVIGEAANRIPDEIRGKTVILTGVGLLV